MALYGVTLQQLAGKVQSANRTMAAGRLRDEGQQIGLVAGQSLTAPAEIAGLLLTTRDNRPVYVGDVTTIEFVPDMSDQIVAHIDRASDDTVMRSPAVTLAFAKRAGSNAVVVADNILDRTAALQETLIPDSVAVEITRNYGETAQKKGRHAACQTVSGHAVDHPVDAGGDWLARKHRCRRSHPGHHSAHALCRMDHGVHA